MNKRGLFCIVSLMAILLITAACSDQPEPPGGADTPGRFDRAERYKQFIGVNRTVDCKGTMVTIEKVLFDKTGTFMVASVEGPTRTGMDSLHVDLFDDQGLVGRSSFTHNLAGGKILLTFKPVQEALKSLRMEFFGGPVGYGSGRAVLGLSEFSFNKVSDKYIREYRPAKAVEKPGYYLQVDKITSGISETEIQYKLAALGDFDGLKHGWLYDWYNNFSPEGEILSVSDGGRKLEPHLSSSNCLGPYYRVSRDGRTMVGTAKHDAMLTEEVQIRLTDVYGFYIMNEMIPLDGIKDRIDINRKVAAGSYTLYIKSFFKEDKESWVLDYSVLDLQGEKVDAAIEAGIYMKSDNYRMNLSGFGWFRDAAGGDRRLVIPWHPMEGGDSLIYGPVIKITRLGIRQDNIVADIDLDNSGKSLSKVDETGIMAAIDDYYHMLGIALREGDVSIFEDRYGYLKPKTKDGFAAATWPRHMDFWLPREVTDYYYSINDPVITLHGNKAVADIKVMEKIVRNEDTSGGEILTVFYLEKVDGRWRITGADELSN